MAKKSKKSVSNTEKIFIVIGFFILIVGVPFSINKSINDREFYINSGIEEVTGICTDNYLQRNNRYISYEFEYNNSVYFNRDRMFWEKDIQWAREVEKGDSMVIQVSIIKPEYNFLVY